MGVGGGDVGVGWDDVWRVTCVSCTKKCVNCVWKSLEMSPKYCFLFFNDKINMKPHIKHKIEHKTVSYSFHLVLKGKTKLIKLKVDVTCLCGILHTRGNQMR